MPTLGGVFRPSDDITFTGTIITTGATTLASPTLTSPTITGTTSIGSGTTITSPTLTAPVITAPATGSTGMMITKSGVITELTGTATYTITIPVPAGAWIHSIKVTNQALWTAGTSASLTVGDTENPDGYFEATDVKAGALVLGEVLDTASANNWGGEEGAYLVSATGQRGPTATNFGPYYAAGSNIIFAVAKSGAGTAGRTHCSVTYSVGEVIAQTVA